MDHIMIVGTGGRCSLSCHTKFSPFARMGQYMHCKKDTESLLWSPTCNTDCMTAPSIIREDGGRGFIRIAEYEDEFGNSSKGREKQVLIYNGQSTIIMRTTREEGETEYISKQEVLVEKSEDMDNIERLPEGCISDILSLTSPADACRSSLVLTLFKSEADSDALWEKFLPADYQEIISRAFYPFPSAALSKKELYYRLSDDPLLIDAGLKSFQLEKSSGKKCIMLGAKELAIAWRHNPNHWRWEGHPGSRFPQVAELQWICWFEIRGKLDTTMLSPKTYYAAYLVVRLNGDVYGFNGEPIKAKVKVVGQAGDNSSVCSKERLIYFDVGGEHSPPDPVLEGQYIARERGDGWMEVELGHFYNEGGDSEGWEVHMSVLEIGRTKRGLIVQADSDALSEKFLPDDYQDIISRALYPFPPPAATSKKELYYRLCDEPLLIDNGLKSFQLEKCSVERNASCLEQRSLKLIGGAGNGEVSLAPGLLRWPDCIGHSRLQSTGTSKPDCYHQRPST
ncbi:hypothetical protein C5167_040418 [Papaver somniferum]|uniref:F-box domain-containing protein n=1 Tax=Papaver somniferum TaxID=3469 RepID=A0A4Y7IEV2_PAPSO|nr:hypothetical protein C5167_040418 [Papaver somniferum]